MDKFIDLSEWNTINNYDAIGCSGVKGVIIKASEGTTETDKTFEGKYSNLNGKTNLGFYHYLTSTSQPETQAQHFYDLIKNKSMQIKPMLDIEQDSLKIYAENFAKRFMEEFKKLSGLEMVIYSGRCFIEDYFSDEFCNNNLFWVADYSNSKPIIPKCKKIIAWQYTDTCKDYPFIFGDVDCSILYDEDLFFIIENIEIPYSEPFDNTEAIKKFDIKMLQGILNDEGCTDKHWNELVRDGIAGELTLSACPTVSIGAKGLITQWIQIQLESLVVDGIFGEKTRQAVIEFQENHSLDGDGIVGKNTWRKLLGM